MRLLSGCVWLLLLSVLVVSAHVVAQETNQTSSLDERVESFLENHRQQWRDMNIPMRDGKLLYDIIVENGYTRALEIGTSTGHSAIWIAWALSKTGGKLVTIEIDKSRHNQALENFEKAGVSKYIDARLADAHKLVKELDGPFDFVFSDADKQWYKQYFVDVAPKLNPGGCFTAHNVSMRWGRYRGGIQEFVDYVQNLSTFETTIENERSTGILISYKKPASGEQKGSQ